MKNERKISLFNDVKLENPRLVKGGGWIMEDELLPSIDVKFDNIKSGWTMEDEMLPSKEANNSGGLK